MTAVLDKSQLSDFHQSCLRQYDVGEVEVQGELSGGMFARPLLVSSSQGRFVLRTHSFRCSESAFRFQAEAVQTVASLGVCCPVVIPTRDGAWCIPLQENDGVVALHEYVDGIQYTWHEWQHLKETEGDFLFRLGRSVARLHNALASAKPGGEPQLSIELPPIQFHLLERVHRLWQDSIAELQTLEDAQISQAGRALLHFADRIDEHWNVLLRLASERGINELPQQVVHGDVSAVNIIWGEDGQLTFIDWDALHVGLRLYDALGDILHRVAEDQPHLNRYRVDHIRDYLAGYERELEEPLTDLERGLIHVFSLARQLEDLRQRMTVLRNLAERDDARFAQLITMRVEMMDQIQEHL